MFNALDTKLAEFTKCVAFSRLQRIHLIILGLSINSTISTHSNVSNIISVRSLLAHNLILDLLTNLIFELQLSLTMADVLIAKVCHDVKTSK